MALLYHLSTEEDWEKALNKGVYEPNSFKQEGFIHASVEAELIPSADLHFEGFQNLVILVLVEKQVKSILKWEPGREGKLFPHLYGKIPLEWVENTYLLIRNKAGKWEWLKG